MDPIHPIVPELPVLPPITPARNAGRIDREAARSGSGADQRRRRKPQGGDGAAERQDYAYEDAGAQLAGDDEDEGFHVNVTA
jgi:hypothetical protein